MPDINISVINKNKVFLSLLIIKYINAFKILIKKVYYVLKYNKKHIFKYKYILRIYSCQFNIIGIEVKKLYKKKDEILKIASGLNLTFYNFK